MLPSLPNTFMITILCRTDKPLSQKIYDSVVDSIDIQQIRCCCGHAGTLIHHGSYRRSVKAPNGLLTLRIIRVKCSFCGKTHALLLSGIVPYSRISLRDQAEIIECHLGNGVMSRLLDRCPSIDENNVKYVIRQYRRHWKERLLSESLLTSRIPDLVVGCFRAFSQQFMQVHSTVNRLFQTPT